MGVAAQRRVTVQGKVHLRVPGFYSRQGVPYLVQAQGLPDHCGQVSVRYTAEALVRGLLGRVEAEEV